MRPRHWMIVLRVATLIALAASVALYADYTSISPAFCTSADTGCGAVRRSGLGYPFGIPMPTFGLAGFAALFTLSMWNAPLRSRALPAVALLGGAIALALLVVQAVKLKTFCFLCVVTDVSAMIAGGAALLWARGARSEEGTPTKPKKRRSSRPPERADALRSWAWWLLALIAVAAPLIWPRVKPKAPVPEQILSLYKPGKINVIEFADYECPFCRMLHPELKKLVSEYGADVNFVRLNMPLKSHPNALGAAKGAVCAELQGKGDEMADALFAQDDLTLSAIRKTSVSLGLDAQKFDKCLEDPETLARLNREERLLRDAGFEGLPTTYIGAQRIIGVREQEVFREAFEKAKRGEGNEGIPPWLFIGILGLLVGGAVGLGRDKG